MTQSAPDPHGQAQYQVRFDWGVDGAERIGRGADVIVVVDVLSFSTAVIMAAEAGGALPSPDGSAVCASLLDHPATVVAGALRNRRAVARWALERQGAKGDRFVVAVVAAGERWSDDAAPRFAVEDLLGAGAVVDALADLGIDYYSPEAAAAAAAFGGLRHATGQLTRASASGQELLQRDRGRDVDVATDIDASGIVPVLGELGFLATRSH